MSDETIENCLIRPKRLLNQLQNLAETDVIWFFSDEKNFDKIKKLTVQMMNFLSEDPSDISAAIHTKCSTIVVFWRITLVFRKKLLSQCMKWKVLYGSASFCTIINIWNSAGMANNHITYSFPPPPNSQDHNSLDYYMLLWEMSVCYHIFCFLEALVCP